MREIKFGCMWSDGKRWMELRYTLDQMENGEHFEDLADMPMLKKFVLKHRRQYTYVSDSYGVEVYEGDWLTARGAKTEHGAQVVWSNTISAFVIDIPDGPVISQDYVDSYSLVVTGNIYQNPELLEKRK